MVQKGQTEAFRDAWPNFRSAKSLVRPKQFIGRSSSHSAAVCVRLWAWTEAF